jgi:hypothetical protein
MSKEFRCLARTRTKLELSCESWKDLDTLHRTELHTPRTQRAVSSKYGKLELVLRRSTLQMN